MCLGIIFFLLWMGRHGVFIFWGHDDYDVFCFLRASRGGLIPSRADPSESWASSSATMLPRPSTRWEGGRYLARVSGV